MAGSAIYGIDAFRSPEHRGTQHEGHEGHEGTISRRLLAKALLASSRLLGGHRPEICFVCFVSFVLYSAAPAYYLTTLNAALPESAIGRPSRSAVIDQKYVPESSTTSFGTSTNGVVTSPERQTSTSTSLQTPIA